MNKTLLGTINGRQVQICIYSNEMYFCLLREKREVEYDYLYKYLRNGLLHEKFLQTSQHTLGP